MNLEKKTIAALDPGRDKCGFAVLHQDGRVLMQRVIETSRLEAEVQQAYAAFAFDVLVEGNGTTSKAARGRISKLLPGLCIEVVDEYRTTDMARKAYWQANPPHGWRRLLPVTMQVPPVPVDDFVAVILGQRYLEEHYHE
ncbi:pre-16S rRNA-processing nuclease YqgF [Mitsuokella sp.]|uniref:pre-16S rRNA-processing nuclease YqgF n=1 Tax=Mitsuokella TaxID=52225 RepID=UPI0029DF65F0|nr:pre-16S rRNA-processing nuclease YqgF [Mitsuokella sp.]MDD6382763.1 pre-16S rRNA-processing nuclease YqgF [Selenomonadaceae bacterium]MDY4473812.1 pre-16S rRNA-processing nuclease YqgF [Mitsuokella sp.]